MKNLQPLRHGPRTKTTRHYLVGLLVLGSLVVASPALAGKLHKAAEKGNLAKVERLIAKGADVNAKDTKFGATPLHWVAKKGHTAVAELLIAKGADVNAKLETGHTPLYSAAFHGYTAIAELLIANGADVNAKLKTGYTPLHPAATLGYKAVVELLIANGADVNAKGGPSRTPLHGAARTGQLAIAELLIAKGSDVNAKDRITGGTPLHYAAAFGHTPVAELLIAGGADVNSKDKDGKTPLRLATDKGHKDLAKLLGQHAADRSVALKRAPAKATREAAEPTFKWDAEYATPGTSLTLEERKRIKSKQRGTVIIYEILASGFTGSAVLWRKSGSSYTRSPATIDESGTVRVAGSRTITIARLVPGAALDIALVSGDRRAHAKTIPFPIEAREANCSASVELVTQSGLLFLITFRGFQPGEGVTIHTMHNYFGLGKRVSASARGEIRFPVSFGPGDRGTATVTAAADSCTVSVQYKVGRDAMVLQ